MSSYIEEQQQLENDIDDIRAYLSKEKEAQDGTESFVDNIKKYTNFTELTPLLLNEFIEKVIVHNRVGRGKNKTQRVDIVFNFIGSFCVPSYYFVPFEIEEQVAQIRVHIEKEKVRKEREQEKY